MDGDKSLTAAAIPCPYSHMPAPIRFSLPAINTAASRLVDGDLVRARAPTVLVSCAWAFFVDVLCVIGNRHRALIVGTKTLLSYLHNKVIFMKIYRLYRNAMFHCHCRPFALPVAASGSHLHTARATAERSPMCAHTVVHGVRHVKQICANQTCSTIQRIHNASASPNRECLMCFHFLP